MIGKSPAPFSFAILVFLFVCFADVFAGQEGDARVHVSLPGKDWRVSLPLMGGKVAWQNQEGYEFRSLAVHNEKTRFVLSVDLEKVEGAADSRSCRERMWQRERAGVPFAMRGIQLRETERGPAVEYRVEEHDGQRLDQQHLKVYQSREDVCIMLHVSKAHFRAPDELVMLRILNAINTEMTPAGEVVAIQGTLRHGSEPIVQADIFLQFFADEKCAKMFDKGDHAKLSRKAAEQLGRCAPDAASIRVGPDGRFIFTNLSPGWYAVRFLWEIQPKPNPMAPFTRSGFLIVYAGYKDHSGRYDTMAQGRPFFFNGDKSVTFEFDDRAP